MENYLWVFYVVVLLATSSCALDTEAAASEEAMSEANTEMVTNPVADEITIANQGNDSAGSTIYVTLPPEDHSAEMGSVEPSGTQMPSLATTMAAAQEPSSSPQVSSTTAAPVKPPLAPPAMAANEIPQKKDDKPMPPSKNSHEKASAMESAAFLTTSSLPILVSVVVIALMSQS